MSCCPICVEKFNKATHNKVQCLCCGYASCRKCVERYLIENTVTPQCMSCKQEWNMEFLRTILPKSFMDKSYRDHQKDAVLVEAEANVGRFQELARVTDLKEHAEQEQEKAKVLLLKAKKAWSDARNNMEQLKRKVAELEGNPDGQNNTQRRDFFVACPSSNCRGKLSHVYKCGLCDQWFCPDCYASKGNTQDTPHVCKQDDLDTVKLLKDNTRPCPKCHVGIFKTMGCDQMWCVQCHTCFSWRTGNILNGTVHNPHFYEYQRRIGNGNAPRVPGDIPCGGMPTIYEIRDRMCGEDPNTSMLYEIHRVATHITNVTMQSVYRCFNSRDRDHRQYGVQYLRGKINRDHWRDLLYRAVRKEEKYRRYYQVLETLTTNLAEYLRQWVGGEDAHKVRQACEELFQYANEESDKMRKQYSMKLPVLTPNMTFNH